MKENIKQLEVQISEWEKKFSGLKDLMNMVIHDFRNPASLVDAQLDRLADIIGIQYESDDVSPQL